KGILGEDQYQKIKKNLFCQPEDPDDKDFYINFHPNKTVGYERCDAAFPIPEWIPMTFPPSSKMNMDDVCSYTCADEQNGDEVLIKTTSGVVGDRAALNSLVPRTAVDQQIINLVVERANWMIDGIGTSKTVWFFPTEFAQYALNQNYETAYVLDLYKDKYMSTKSYVSKIFIPLNDEGVHWYLLVVDFFEQKLIWLDSLRSDERRQKRRHVILKMAMFIEEMLHEKALDELRPHIAHKMVTNFCLDEHSTPRQRIGS
ncbi:ubiquitin-like-specific protease ESD4-like, partial [Trifolium medium]|nr:ubiquitin-like-specific protease ESD4-like [Trifolium medium]